VTEFAQQTSATARFGLITFHWRYSTWGLWNCRNTWRYSRYLTVLRYCCT